MSLQKMLEYQKIDYVYYRQQKELNESIERKNALTCKDRFNKQVDAFTTLREQVKNNIIALKNAEGKLAELDKMKARLDERMKTLESDEDFAEVGAQLDEYDKAVAELNKEVTRITKTLDEASFQSRRIVENMEELNKSYQENIQSYSQKKALFEKNTQSTRETLAELAKDIEPEYMQKYTELRNARKMPAFVSYEKGNCSGCGMDISIEVDKKMVNPGDVAECPHCGRIVYKL